jgi:xylan 1,4-beta-xylosidase
MELGNPAFVAKRQQHLYSSAETEVSFAAKADNEKAGITIFQDEGHFYYLCKSSSNDKPVIQLFKSNPENKSMDLIMEVLAATSAEKVLLRIDSEGEYYSFYCAFKPNDWIPLKEKVDAKFLSTEVAGGFIGCVYGLYATSSGKETSNNASFKYLRYSGNDPMYK